MTEPPREALDHAWGLLRKDGWANYLVVRGWTATLGTDEGDVLRIPFRVGQVRPFGPHQVADLLKAGAVLPMEH